MMKWLILSLFIFNAANQMVYPRLQTGAIQTLSKNNYLQTPDGQYRLKLNENCTLHILKFDYETKGFSSYALLNSPQLSGLHTCENISLSRDQKGLVTDKNQIFLQLNQNTTYDDLTFKVVKRTPSSNDSVLVVLEGDYQDAMTGNHMEDRKYLPENLNGALPFITMDIGNGTSSPNMLKSLEGDNNYTNDGNWNFLYQDQKLKISNPNSNDSRQIDLKGVSITEDGIKDRQGEDRYAVIPGRTFHPRAGESSCANPDDLYYEIDEKYPVMRVFDGNKYQVAEFGLKEPQGYPTVYCPQGTLQHKLQCVTRCPIGYKKQIRNGQGKCVLACQVGSIEQNGVCTSYNYNSGIISQDFKCPDNSDKYEFGCICNGLINNSTQRLSWNPYTNSCQNVCPQGTIKLADQGICAKCPHGCKQCQVDQQNRSYLVCTNQDNQTSACDITNCHQCSNNKCLKCQPLYALSVSGLTCQKSCNVDEKYILGVDGEGYCQSIKDGSPDDYFGGMHDEKPYLFRNSCPNNQKIQQSQCLQNCKTGYRDIEGICVCPSGSVYWNQKCVNKPSVTPPGYYYDEKYNTYINCPSGCASCTRNHCQSCVADHVLVVSSTKSHCRRNNILFSCDSRYFNYDKQNQICSPKKLANEGGNCFKQNVNNAECLVCKPSFFNITANGCSQNTTCPFGYFHSRGQCYRQIDNCQQSELVNVEQDVRISDDVDDHDWYNSYTHDGKYISNNPAVEVFSVRDKIYSPEADSSINTKLNRYVQKCQRCRQNYVLDGDKCIQDINDCSFEYEGNCVDACPEDTTPIDKNGKLVCSQQVDNNPDRLKIDASVYPMDDGDKKLYYFVVDKVLQDNPQIPYYQVFEDERRMLQAAGSNQFTKFNNNSYLAIESEADEVILDFRQGNKLSSIKSIDGQFLGQSVYGVKNTNTHLEYSRNWLAILSFVISIILIILHAIYIGNSLLYKVDNALIFAQGLFFFSFINLMVGIPLAQYYNGFRWSHFGFFPNYFKGTIPDGYYEGYSRNTITPDDEYRYVPNSYRLLTADANYIRNVGYAFSLLLTFLVAFFIVLILIWILKKFCGKYELWYKKVARQALFASIEFVCMAIVYWGVAHLLYNKGRVFTEAYDGEQDDHTSYRRSCSIAAIVFLALYLIYMVFRWCINKIGGLYTFKRIAVAVILAASSYQTIDDNGSISGNKVVVIAMCGLQVIFAALRFVLEKPYLKRQKFFIIAEALAMIAAYLIMYLWNDTGVISIYCSIILMLFIILFVEDLLDVYNDSKDQFYEEDYGFLPGTTHKAVTDKNRNDWRNHEENIKKNENPWVNNKMSKFADRNNDNVPPSSERAQLRSGKQL